MFAGIENLKQSGSFSSVTLSVFIFFQWLNILMIEIMNRCQIFSCDFNYYSVGITYSQIGNLSKWKMEIIKKIIRFSRILTKKFNVIPILYMSSQYY